jgi:glycosyltransferase involved in cell wall biosynthesis
MTTPLFTVFTPTYNRAHTLHRVYDSLCLQTLRDFEWLVIDDGSTDNTTELIANWAKIADFPIRYVKQKNSGKHIAQNHAVSEARGSLFATIDSDDALLPHTLERVIELWHEIPESERILFSGIGGLCRNQHGAIIGDCYPISPLDSNTREVIYLHRVRGEKWGVSRTDLLRRYRFPEIAQTRWIPEGILGLQMSQAYKRRYVNEVFRIYYVDESHERGSNLSDRANLAKTAPGRLYYCACVLNHDLSFFWRSPVPFLKAAVMLPIVGHISGESFPNVFASLQRPAGKALVLMTLPFALLFYLAHKIHSLVKSGQPK